MDNEKLMTVWCRMWNEDPSLAHDLMTDECVQWSNHTDGLDSVVGPAAQERFITGYRARHVNIFSPRVLADAGDRFAYLWDVRTPEGEVLTGLDVNIVKDGRIHENWTFVGERRCELLDPGPAGPVDAATLEELCRGWVRLREGRAEPSEHVVTSDFALFSGEGGVGGVSELPAFKVHRLPVVDLASGYVALLWTAKSPADGADVGGVDLLTVRDGRFARGWSLIGNRSFRY